MVRVARSSVLLLAVIAGSITTFTAISAEKNPAAAVTAQRMQQADKDAGQWMSHGRTWGEQRFSPLQDINEKNVKKLGLAWFARHRHLSRRGGDAAGHRWRDVQHLGLGRDHCL